MTQISAILSLALVLAAAQSHAGLITQSGPRLFASGGEQVACTVNFEDTTGYPTPYCRTATDAAAAPITVFFPSYVEANVPNKYYIDLTSGANSTCSQGSPCDSFADITGKTITGGAIVYCKGSGGIADSALAGSSSNPIIVKPWDDATNCTITGRNDWTTNHHYVFFDGGPNMRIRFSSTGGSDFDPSIYFSEVSADTTVCASMTFQSVTFYRTRWDVPGSLGIQFASWGAFCGLAFINSEFKSSNTGAQKHVYISQCGQGSANNHDGRQGYNLAFIGNVFRDTPGEAIELRMAAPAANIDGFYAEGNAAHNVGKGTCGAGFNCRSWITFSSDASGCGASGGSFSGVVAVHNNLAWDTGQHSLALYEFPAGGDVQGNTFLLWGNGGAGGGQYPEAALSNFDFNDAPGDIANNIICATGTYGGDARRPFPNNAQPSGAQYNACISGSNCTSSGTSGTKQTITCDNSTFVNFAESSADWGKMRSDSPTKDNGTSVSGRCPAKDYFGTARPQGAACDIGAFEQ